MTKIKLKNQSIYKIHQSSFENNPVVMLEDGQDPLDIIKDFTEENLSLYTILNHDDSEIAVYSNKKLVLPCQIVDYDGTFFMAMNLVALDEKTVRIKQLEDTNKVNQEKITELETAMNYFITETTEPTV